MASSVEGPIEATTGRIIGIIGPDSNRQFQLEEAKQILPVIQRITEFYFHKVGELTNQLERAQKLNDRELAADLEHQVSEMISQWQLKLQKLGARPKGLWVADFDSGDGFFCWKYPEPTIQYWHGYDDGYTKRVSVDCRPAQMS